MASPRLGAKVWQEVQDRKAQIRDKYYKTLKTTDSGGPDQTTPKTPGDAATQAVTDLDPSAWGVEPASPSTGTSATATETAETSSGKPESTTPAESTRPDSAKSIMWMATPVGFVEHNLRTTIVDPSGSLMPGLPPRVQSSLQALATARHEAVQDTIYQIAEFFVENEDERAEGSLKDAIIFYVANYVSPSHQVVM